MSKIEFLTHRELARRWKISERTLEMWEQKGVITAVRLTNRTKRYRLVDVEGAEKSVVKVDIGV